MSVNIVNTEKQIRDINLQALKAAAANYPELVFSINSLFGDTYVVGIGRKPQKVTIKDRKKFLQKQKSHQEMRSRKIADIIIYPKKEDHYIKIFGTYDENQQIIEFLFKISLSWKMSDGSTKELTFNAIILTPQEVFLEYHTNEPLMDKK